MAEYLASIFGTEKDKVNCSFYFKIGACRHGERCSRIHNKPTFSQTLLLQNLYQNPQNVTQSLDPLGKETQITRVHTMSDEEAQEHFDDFFEDVFVELEDKYGEIEEMNVCDNLGDHLVGNVYVKFRREEDAERASIELNNRWFGGRPILAELSPVTDFREACCRQYEMGECTRSGFCNFMHLKPISRELRRELYGRRRAAALERRIASYIGGDGPTRSRSVERRPRSRDRDHRSERGDRSNRGDRSDRSSRRSSKHADSKEERISSRSRRSRSRSHDSKHKSGGGDSKSSSSHHRRHRDRESRHGGEGHRRGSRDQAAAASSSHADFNEQDEDNYGPQPGAAPPVHSSNSQDGEADYYSNNHNYHEEDDGRPHAQSQSQQPQGYNYNDDDSNSYNGGAGSQPPPPMNDDSYNYRSGYQEDSNPRPMDDDDSNNQQQQQYHQNSNSNDEEDSRPMMAGGIYGSLID